MSDIPRVRITFSWLLHKGASQVLYEQSDWSKENKLASIEQHEEWSENYRQAWKPKSKLILSAMQEIVDLKFINPSIEVTLAPMFYPMSQPLIIGFGQSSDEFVDILTHELFHVLYTDNQKYSNRDKKDTGTDLNNSDWQKLYGKGHSFVTLTHIPVHAGLKYIYLDVLKEPKRLDRDIKQCQQWPEYKKAWEYVEKNDYKKILEITKESYQ